VLVVEDDADLRALLLRRLTGEGYAARGAGTLAEGRSALREWGPDLLVLDVQLPDGSGFDLCVEARAATSAPIVYLTCMGQDESVLRGFTVGGDDYVTKPFNLDVLFARISAQLRRSGVQAGRVELPPLVIDLVAGTVAVDGRAVEVSKKELQLLVFFATHAGRAFSNAELLEAVWRDTSGVESNTVRVHISALRRKLGLGPDSPFALSTTESGRYVFRRVRFVEPGGPP
jgi:DNA-binding response OmpR family regulator